MGLTLFYVGFLDLSPSRTIGGFGGEAPLDWFSINKYCKEQGILGEQRDDFFYHIRQLDIAYLAYKAAKSKSATPTKGK